MRNIAYLTMDVHARHCTLGEMSADGTFRGNCEFDTSEKNIFDALKTVKAISYVYPVEFRAADSPKARFHWGAMSF